MHRCAHSSTCNRTPQRHSLCQNVVRRGVLTMVGQTLSHYEVLKELGRGGMGAVYEARDIVLDRIVAIKVLHPDLANPTRERRFIQEAKAASSFNHPNIVTIYEIFHVGAAPCIAMEYVTGETLEKQLEQGPMPLRRGLNCAIQIADALARAHQAGIVHRDVKPSNIMITDTGLVKVLDFGLAKLTQVSEEFHTGERLTQEGRIVGTPPYLSPEQALAEKVDARSDIFSFGAVMYEMFSGKRPFERESNVDMLAAVVREHPKKIRSVAKDLPASLERIIGQCLEKKVDCRPPQMEDVKEALESIRHSDTLSSLLAAQRPRPLWQSPTLWLIAGLLALIGAGGAMFWWNRGRNDAPARAPVLTRITSDEGLTTDPAVGPDGKFLVYASDRGGDSLDIWIQPLSGGQAVQLTRHPADDREPAFSPDGSNIAFRSERDGGGVYLKSILGGEERLIVRKGRRPRFSPNGKWLAYWIGFSTGDPTSPGSNKIYVVPSNGGTPKQLVPDFESALYPIWSPDSTHLLFLGASSTRTSASGTITGANRPVDRMDWWIANLDGAPPVKTGVHSELSKQGLSVWASSGAGIAPDDWLAPGNRVVFSASMATTDSFRDSMNIWSVPLSSRTWKADGAARQITSGTSFETQPAALASGEILFANAESKTSIWMLPLNANEAKQTGELKQLTRGAAFHGQPSAALNGSKVVYYATKSGNMDIWVLDLLTGAESPLTSTPVGEFAPQISADGSTVYYSLYGKREAYSMPSGGGEATKICHDCGTWSVSHDREKILYWYSTTQPIVSIGLLQTATGKKIELIAHPQYSLYQPHFSPDDSWIAFLAKTGHDRSRVYVVPFRGTVAQDTVSWIPITDGDNLDDKPRWSPDGSLLYFTSERDGFRCIWAQRLNRDTKLPSGAPSAVQHFHTSRRSLMNVGLGPLEISVTSSALVFNLGERIGNIWRVSRQ
jgi:eukaryotic-like serine/threonine-protein kinase